MRLRLVEGTPPEAAWSECLEYYGLYGETMDGTPFVVATDRVEVSLRDGTRTLTKMRPLPPGTIITITVRDAAPHDVKVVKPGPAVEWLTWGQVKTGGTVVAKDGKAYIKSAYMSGYRLDANLIVAEADMIVHYYRRPFDPWSLVPVEESEVTT